MNECPLPIDNLAQAIDTVNRIIGLPDRGFPKIETPPREVNINPIWAVIAYHEPKNPFNREIFFGIDSIGGTLVCTETAIGDEYGVTPERSHLIGIHTHPRRGGINPFYDARPAVAPSEMASMLDIPTQYAELVFTRGQDRDYPCVLAMKTDKAAQVRYEGHEDLRQELGLSATLTHGSFWSRESDLVNKCDALSREKSIAIYRGTIKPKSTHQPPLQLI